MPLKYLKQPQFVKAVSSLKTTKHNKPLKKKITIKKTFEPLLNALGYTIIK